MKKSITSILASLAIFILAPAFYTCTAQPLELDVDPQENIMSLTEERSLQEAMVGIEKGSRKLEPGEMYRVSLSGAAYRSSGEGMEANVLVYYSQDDRQLLTATTMEPDESFVFRTPDRQKRVLIQAAVLDPGAAYDNHGSLTLTVSPQ